MRNGSRAWPRSQYRNAPSPQAYSSHHQQQPSLRRLGLIVVSGPLYSHGKKPASPNHAVHLLPLSHSLGTHTKPPGGQTIATSPPQTSPPPAPEANDHASTPEPQTRKASHSLDFNFDVQETGGSSLLACLFPRFRHHLWVPPAATSPQSRPGSRLGPRRRCHRVRVCRDLREAGTTARSRQPTTWLTVGGRNIDTEGPLNGGRNLVPGETPDC